MTSDVSVIYQGWYEVLRTGTFPLDDVTWQYPPAAALAVLSPALLPFLGYATAFFVLALLCRRLGAAGCSLYAGPRPGKSPRGRLGVGRGGGRCSGPPRTPATT